MKTIWCVIFVCSLTVTFNEALLGQRARLAPWYQSGIREEVRVLLQPLRDDFSNWVHEKSIPLFEANLKHAVVQAFKKVYEFNKGGLNSYYGEGDLREFTEHLSAGYTSVSKQDFEAWFNSRAIQKKYDASQYNLLLHNCQTFVEEACRFLGVRNPHNLRKIKSYNPLAHAVVEPVLDKVVQPIRVAVEPFRRVVAPIWQVATKPIQIVAEPARRAAQSLDSFFGFGR